MDISTIFESEERAVFEAVRVGVVSSTDSKNATARVYFEDRDDVVSFDLPVITKGTMETKDYWMPVVNEQVVCLFLANDPSTGFIVGSPYSESDKPISAIHDAGMNKRGIYIDAENYIEWDADHKEFVISASKPIRIKGTIETE